MISTLSSYPTQQQDKSVCKLDKLLQDLESSGLIRFSYDYKKNVFSLSFPISGLSRIINDLMVISGVFEIYTLTVGIEWVNIEVDQPTPSSTGKGLHIDKLAFNDCLIIAFALNQLPAHTSISRMEVRSENLGEILARELVQGILNRSLRINIFDLNEFSGFTNKSFREYFSKLDYSNIREFDVFFREISHSTLVQACSKKIRVSNYKQFYRAFFNLCALILIPLNKNKLRFKSESPWKNKPPELWLMIASYLFNSHSPEVKETQKIRLLRDLIEDPDKFNDFRHANKKVVGINTPKEKKRICVML